MLAIGGELTPEAAEGGVLRVEAEGTDFAWQDYRLEALVADVDIDLQPENFGHVWTAPAKPKYTIELRNGTGKATTAKLTVKTRSHEARYAA